MPERLPLRRRLAFAAAAMALALAMTGGAALAADLYLHHKYERTSAFNIWGYRGPTIGTKAPRETRLIVLGGSAAFGYGVPWNEAFPYVLEERLNQASRRYRVVNLAFNNESAASFLPTLEDYRYLQYDAAILYEGYNDLQERPRTTSFRRQSTMFTTTGYLPLLPMILREKFYDWRYDGDIGRGYRQAGAEQTVFRPTGDDSTRQSLASQLQSGPGTWSNYCDTVLEAIAAARARGTLVVVASQPYVSDLHVEQQAALRRSLESRFGSDGGVRYLDLGRTVDLRDSALAYDGLHLTAEGNRVIAEAFAQPVKQLLESVKR